MDLWKSPKSGRHVERLADIVEIIMGAARAEHWFQSIWNTDQYRGRLPALFSLLTTLCKIIQSLSARLGTGYLKHKLEYVQQFGHLHSLEFSQKWACDYSARGLLLFGLLTSSQQAQ